MGRALRIALAGLFAAAVAPSLAQAAPTMAVTATCTYTGGRFAVAGKGFDPGTPVAVDVMQTAQPLVGAPLAGRTTTPDARGTFVEAFDVPPTVGVATRSVRARPQADLSTSPQLLATAPLRVATRSVAVTGPRRPAASSIEHWHIVGLPEGTPLYAHFRRRGETVARASLGRATDPCGRLDFDLPVLPREAARGGAREVWMTADREFRRPRKGVYVHRRLTASTPSVRAGAISSRLAPLDPRLTAPVTNGMAADISRAGLVDLTFVDALGSTVEFLERIGDRLVPLGTARAGPDDVLTSLPDATTWSCERSERRFVGVATRPDGELALAGYSVRTPSCASRFELSAPRRAEPRSHVRVRIVDHWGIGGIAPSLCVTAPGARRACRPVALARGVTVASRRLRVRERGAWRVQLRLGDRSLRRATVTVGGGRAAAPPVPTVLATGDSTMQGIDGFLGDELGDAATVVSDVRIGTAISQSEQPLLPGADDPTPFQWGLLAAQQTARLRQAATVVSLGAAEGFEMVAPDGARVGCCDAPWVAEYERRVRLMMAAYARRGAARVLWLTVPLPRDDRRRIVTSAVNAAIVDADRAVAGARVVRLDLVFTPDGYRDVIRYRGQAVDVRDADGVHLNVAGTAIAAKLVAQALRDGASR